MSEILFWKKWPVPHKIGLYIGFAALLLSIVFFLGYFSISIERLVTWEVKNTVETIDVQMDSYQRHLIEYPVVIQNYLVNGEYQSKGFGVRFWESKIYLGLLVVAMSLMLTAVTNVKKSIWFALSLTFLVFYLAFLDLGSIGGGYLEFSDKQISWSLIIGLIVLLVPVVLINMFFTNLKFAWRLLVISSTILLFGWYVFATSQIHNTALAITNQGMLIPIVLLSVFTFVVGYDVVSFLGSVVSYSKSSSGMSNVYHLLIGAGLYLINLLLWFLESRDIIEWNLVYFNPFLLFTVSALVGIWGSKRRSQLYKKLLDFQYEGAIMYVGLAILSFATIAYNFACVNDGFIIFFEDLVLVTHLILGFLFLIYLLFNFVDDLKVSKPIYKVMYKPLHMKYTFVRLGAAMVILALLVREDMIHIRWVKSALRSMKGDVEFAEGKLMDARFYYKQANNVVLSGIKTNYFLSQLYKLDGHAAVANKHLKRLVDTKSAPFVYVIMSQNYHSDEDVDYKDLLILQEGASRFPESEELCFTLANSFASYEMYDSAEVYYNKVLTLNPDNSLAKANLLTLYAKSSLVKEAQSQIEYFMPCNDLNFQTNYLTCMNIVGKNIEQSFDYSFFADSIMTELNGAYANNYLLNAVHGEPKLELLNKVRAYDVNGYNWSLWEFVEGIYNARQHNVKEALASFTEVVEGVPLNFQPYFANLAGIYLYEEGADNKAQEFWERSDLIQSYKVLNAAPMYHALTVLPDMKRSDAIHYLDSLAMRDPMFEAFSQSISKVFEANSLEEYLSLEDHLKYYATVLNRDLFESEEVFEVLKSISKDEIKHMAIIELLDRYIGEYQVEKAEKIWLLQSGNVNTEILNRLNYRYLKLLEAMHRYDDLLAEASVIKLAPQHEKYRNYFVARAHLEKGDLAEAQKVVDNVIKTMPSSEEVNVLIVDILRLNEQYEKAYNKVVDFLVDYPTSIELNKAYCMLSINNYMSDYGITNLEKLKSLLPQSEYLAFEKDFYQALNEHENIY